MFHSSCVVRVVGLFVGSSAWLICFVGLGSTAFLHAFCCSLLLCVLLVVVVSYAGVYGLCSLCRYVVCSYSRCWLCLWVLVLRIVSGYCSFSLCLLCICRSMPVCSSPASVFLSLQSSSVVSLHLLRYMYVLLFFFVLRV